MNSERAVAPTTNEDVVNPPSRLPAERSKLPRGSGGRSRQGSRVGLERARLAAPVEIHAEDFHENPKSDKDPDRFWRPIPEVHLTPSLYDLRDAEK